MGPRKSGLTFLGAMLAWCLLLVAVRVQRTGSNYFLFLVWNLFLACIPLFASRALLRVHSRGGSDATKAGLFFLWLLFLPNAPYILTDIVHLQANKPLLYWYDATMLASFAGTGLLLGYSSLFDIQRIAEHRFGVAAGWAVAVAALVLSGFGIYLGRVHRWNSWDVVADPQGLFAFIFDMLINPTAHGTAYTVSALFGAGLVLGYAGLRWVMAGQVTPAQSVLRASSSESQ